MGPVTEPCRAWWRNCALEADPEILEIDRLEDAIAPVEAGLTRVRSLITGLELCHHKAERWIANIVEAIRSGDTGKGLGTRPEGQLHSAEEVWENACDALSAWCAGRSVEGSVSGVPAAELLALLGERTPLKEWQVQRVVEKVRGSIHWPRSSADYVFLLLDPGDYECSYREACPEQYAGYEELWLATVRTTIRDTLGGAEARLSLALAIDMLWPCHWRFVENLRLVLAAIGGDLEPDEPFAACGRNISMRPGRPRLEVVCRTLQAFCGASLSGGEIDEGLLERLPDPTPSKRWLAASLDKTIRLQLDPQAAVAEQSSLSGPDCAAQADLG
jgi:hypothetical protein